MTFKPNFTINNNILTALVEIEKIKDKLIEIAKSHTLFDIYIRLSSEKMYKRTDVSFSSLSFTKDENTGNGYTATFTVEPVNEFETKVFVSNKKYNSSKGKGATGKGSNRKQNDKSSNGKSFKIGFADYELKDTTVFKNLEQAKQHGKEQGLDIYYSETHNPPYMFVKNVSYVEQFVGDKKTGYTKRGGYALTEDTFRHTKLGITSNRTGTTQEYINGKLYITRGKEKYTIIKCYSSKPKNQLAWDKHGNIVKQ